MIAVTLFFQHLQKTFERKLFDMLMLLCVTYIAINHVMSLHCHCL